MFLNFDTQTRQILTGNLFLIFCCAFYLAWWIIAFKPAGAIKGMKSGWLLLPAFVFGLLAVIRIVRGSNGPEAGTLLLSRTVILLVGVAAYIILLAATRILLKRPVTTELFLIVGWTVVAFLELDALYGTGRFSARGTIVFFVAVAAAAAVGLICYLLYYGLDSRAGYIDGMIPLLLLAAMMAAISVCVVLQNHIGAG